LEPLEKGRSNGNPAFASATGALERWGCVMLRGALGAEDVAAMDAASGLGHMPGGQLDPTAAGAEEDELSFAASVDKVQEVTEQLAEFLVKFSAIEQRAILAPFLSGADVVEGDPEIDTTKVESTRKMEEYDGETQGAIRKIMFDQNQKLQGKPTSDQIRTADIMKDAWNAPGSPFRGTDFDPSLLNLSSPVGDEFFQEVEDRRLQDARRAKDEGAAAAAADP